MDLKPRNIARARADIDPDIYEHLSDYFSSHNKSLYQMIGTDFGW
jgi:hypothetical protein